MKALFNFIKAKIESDVTAIRTVRIWNNQILHSNTTKYKEGDKATSYGTRDEKAFRYPACFVEFIVVDVNNLPGRVRDYILTVRFRVCLESYKFERLDTFDFIDDFDKAIYMLCPTDASGLTFTTFQEIITEFDENHDNVEVPYRDYRTRYRYYPGDTNIQVTGIDLDVEGSIIEAEELRVTEDDEFRILE